MANLVNFSKDRTLLSLMEDAVKETTGRNGRRIFYAITCYFDVEAIYVLADRLAQSLKEKDSKLTGFYIFVDVRDWAKCRVSKSEIIRSVSQKINVNKERIDIMPVYFDGRLFHAKGYGLISESNEKTSKRKGFVATTSGNLTKRGMGVADDSNIELLSITSDSDSIDEFLNLIGDLEESKKHVNKQDEFLLALNIFSSGSFYHKWEGGLSDRVRFSVELNKKGRREYKTRNTIFRGYNSDSKTISKDPINLQDIFESCPKPFLPQFWANYSVDTLLGRWIPNQIADMVDEKLKDSAGKYILAIEEATTSEILKSIKGKLLRELRGFQNQQYIDGDPKEIVDSWLVKVEKLRENHELIKSRIFNYEKIPELLESSNRKLIMHTFNGLQDRLNIGVQSKGVKALIKDAIEQEGMEYVQEKLDYLRNSASNNLKATE